MDAEDRAAAAAALDRSDDEAFPGAVSHGFELRIGSLGFIEGPGCSPGLEIKTKPFPLSKQSNML